MKVYIESTKRKCYSCFGFGKVSGDLFKGIKYHMCHVCSSCHVESIKLTYTENKYPDVFLYRKTKLTVLFRSLIQQMFRKQPIPMSTPPGHPTPPQKLQPKPAPKGA